MKYILILGIVLIAWCPWLSKDQALDIVDLQVASMQEKNPNLCEMFIDRDSITKVPFGYTEEVSYDCTITDKEYGVLQSNNTVFVTFYKGIFGMPNALVRASH